MAQTSPDNLIYPIWSDNVKDGDDSAKLAEDIQALADSAQIAFVAVHTNMAQRLRADNVGTNQDVTIASWSRLSTDYFGDVFGDAFARDVKLVPYTASFPRILNGKIGAAYIPELNYLPLNGSKSATEIRIGDAVRLREVQGARGARLQYTSAVAHENYRPYMEVNAGDWDSHGDVTAGYQCHVTGDGTTPNTGERVYWFLEAHGLEHAANANPDFEGWYSMGVSNRTQLTERGKGRAFILDAGNRPGIAFHFYKPYAELQTNTAFTLDDRARPAIFSGTGPHHSARDVGTLHGGDYINFRREGAIGARFTSVSDTENPAVFMGRSRGTIPAPADVLSGNILGEIQFGTQSDVDEEYVHVPDSGADPRNKKHVTARVFGSATENYTPGTSTGSRLTFEATPNGSATRVNVGVFDPNFGTNETSLYVRYNADGTTTIQRVTLGAPDSGGPGKRVLTVPN